MFEHILVPLDLSGKSARVLAVVRDLAQQHGARVTVLHVIQRIEHIPTREVRGFYRQIEKAARRQMGIAARRIGGADLDSRIVVLIGTPAQAIVDYAAANDVNLIVLGSHKIDRARPARGWATTSYKVGILCRCPVLLVK